MSTFCSPPVCPFLSRPYAMAAAVGSLMMRITSSPAITPASCARAPPLATASAAKPSSTRAAGRISLGGCGGAGGGREERAAPQKRWVELGGRSRADPRPLAPGSVRVGAGGCCGGVGGVGAAEERRRWRPAEPAAPGRLRPSPPPKNGSAPPRAPHPLLITRHRTIAPSLPPDPPPHTPAHHKQRCAPLGLSCWRQWRWVPRRPTLRRPPMATWRQRCSVSGAGGGGRGGARMAGRQPVNAGPCAPPPALPAPPPALAVPPA